MIKTISSLRTKMLFALALGMILLFVLIFFVTRTSLLEGYAKLENDKAIIQLDGALNALDEQSYQLALFTRDNAHWDDMYRYVANPDPAFAVSSYGNVVNVNLKIHALFIVNNKGKILHKNGFSHVTEKPWPIPASLIKAVSKNGLLIDPTKKSTSGFFSTPEGIFIVSAFDILDSQSNGPRRGTFIVARLLDDTLMARVEKVLNTKVSVKTITDNEISAISPELNTMKVIKPLNTVQLAGYSLLNTINKDNRLLLTVIDNREIFKLAESNLNYLYWSSAFAALLLAAFSWVFNKLVLKKITHINDDVMRIGQTANHLGRVVKPSGSDELTYLANGINSMLTELDDVKTELQFEKERAQVTLTSIAEAVITSDTNGCVLYMNTAAESLCGFNSSVAKGKHLQDLFQLLTIDKSTVIHSKWLTEINSKIEDVLLVRSDGQEYVLCKSASLLNDVSGWFGTVTVLHDVTALRTMSNKLSQQARFDALTGLANRYEFERKAIIAIDDSQFSGRTHCVAYIDLDKFKSVNDTSGHSAGDLFLQQLANHLLSRLRSTDTLARLGGDEFALLLMGCGLEKALEIVQDLLKAIQSFRLEHQGIVFKVGASVGLTEITPKFNLNVSALLSTADTACYAAKRDGGNCVHQYQNNDTNMQAHNNLLKWVSNINKAIENDQFVLYIQPFQAAKPNQEAHCELLIRMLGEDNLIITPNQFLPAAEHYQMMPQIDRWVIDKAFSKIAAKGSLNNKVYAINLSGQSLSQQGFLEFVLSKIKQYDVNTKSICFEITETAVIGNIEKAQHFMQTLRAIGCRFSLDDFGNGLCSFAYLKNLDVDFLKIDGMFIKSIATNKTDRAMVESINKIGHVMGLVTIGECAENKEIIEILNEIGIDYAQGYGVAMPELFI